MSDSIKNIFFSVVAIAAVSLLAIGVTAAVWDAQDTNTGNTFASGVIDIELDGTQVGEPEAFFDAAMMKPSDIETAYVSVLNSGDFNVDFELELVNPGYAGGTPRLDEVLDLRIEQVGNLVDVTDSDAKIKFDQMVAEGSTLWTEGNIGAEIVSFGDFTLYEWRTDSNTVVGSNNYVLPPNNFGVYRVDVRLDPDAGNQYQGKTFTVDVRATATQEVN